MSSESYIAWSLLCAGLFAAVLILAGRIFGMATMPDSPKRWEDARIARLRRRRADRLERGTDRYFEELRSIEAALQAETAKPPARAPRWHDAIFRFIAMLVVSGVATSFFSKSVFSVSAPAWSENLILIWIPIAGLQMLVSSNGLVSDGKWAPRLIGGIFLFMGTLAIVALIKPFT